MSEAPFIVACVLVAANVRYSMDYVRRLRSMVDRHMTRPYRFVVMTDDPVGARLDVPNCVAMRLPSVGRIPGWWAKVHLFNKHYGLKGPGLYLDLDVLVVDSLEPICARPAPSFVPDAGNWKGRDGLAVIKRFNSSVMRLEFGSQPELFDYWGPTDAARLWGDQDWLGEQIPAGEGHLMPLEWFPRISQIVLQPHREPKWPADAKVILCKKPKNHEAQKIYPWFDKVWQ